MVTHSLATVRELKILVSARTTFFYIPALLGCCFQIVSTITRLNHRNLIVLGSWALFSLSFFRLRMVAMGIIVFRHQCTSFSAQLTRTCCIPRCPHPWREFAQFIGDAILLVDPRDHYSVMRGHNPVKPRHFAFRAEEAES